MARYRRSLVVNAPPEEVFAYMAAFENVAEWDPGVLEAHRMDAGIDPGAAGAGARYRVVASFLCTRAELEYEVVKHDPPHRVELVAENERFRSHDAIVCEPRAGGSRTRLTYDARLTAKGALALTDPALQLAFRWIGGRAFASLERRLGERWGHGADRAGRAPGRDPARSTLG